MPYAIKKSRKSKLRSAPATNGLVTFQKFYDTVDEKTKADLLDGMIIRDSPAIPKHADDATWTSQSFNSMFHSRLIISASSSAQNTPQYKRTATKISK